MNPDETPPTPLWIRAPRVMELFGFDAQFLERELHRADPCRSPHLLARARKTVSPRLVLWNVQGINRWLESP